MKGGRWPRDMRGGVKVVGEGGAGEGGEKVGRREQGGQKKKRAMAISEVRRVG